VTLLQVWNIAFVLCLVLGVLGHDQTQQMLAHARPKLSETQIAYLNAGAIVIAAAGAATLVTGLAWLVLPS
jgi:hypothetical protein